MVRRAVVVLALLAGMTVTVAPAPAGAAPPSTSWRHETPASVPAQRYDYSLFSDPSTGQTVLFGGREQHLPQRHPALEWLGLGDAITCRLTLRSRPLRPDGCIRPAPRRPVLFGGTILTPDDDVLNYADTWRWTGTNWVYIPTAHFPPPRVHGVLGYDPVSQRLILFGGADIGGWYNDTWTFDGTDWSQLSPATSPPARDRAVMALDSVTGRLIMYGGQSNAGVFNDTWTWTGSNWQQLSPTTSPSVGFEPTMTTDPSTGRPVIFGGWAGSPASYSNALWDWTGTSWVKRNVSPTPGGRLAQLASDAQTGRLVIYGGGLAVGGIGGDTWTFGPNAPTTGWSQLSPGTTPPRAKRHHRVRRKHRTSRHVRWHGIEQRDAERHVDLERHELVERQSRHHAACAQ